MTKKLWIIGFICLGLLMTGCLSSINCKNNLFECYNKNCFDVCEKKCYNRECYDTCKHILSEGMEPREGIKEVCPSVSYEDYYGGKWNVSKVYFKTDIVKGEENWTTNICKEKVSWKTKNTTADGWIDYVEVIPSYPIYKNENYLGHGYVDNNILYMVNISDAVKEKGVEEFWR